MATDVPDVVPSECDRVKELERRLQSLERENRHLKRTIKTSSPDPRPSRETEVACLLETLDDINLDELLEEDDEENWVYRSPVKPSPQQRLLTPEQWLVQGLHNGDVLTGSGRLPRNELVDVRANLYPESFPAGTTDIRPVSVTPEGRASSRSSPESTCSRASNSTYTVSPPPTVSDLEDEFCASPELRRSPLPGNTQTQGQTSRPNSQTPDDNLSSDRGQSLSPLAAAISHAEPTPQPASTGLTHPTGTSSQGQIRPSSGLVRPSSGLTQPRQSSGLVHPQASSGLAQPRRNLGGGIPSSQRSVSQPRSSLPQSGSTQLTRPSGSSRMAPSASGASGVSRLTRPSGSSQQAGPSASASAGTAAPKSGLMRPGARSGLRAPQPARPSSASGLRAPSSHATKKSLPRPNSAIGRPATSDTWRDGCY